MQRPFYQACHEPAQPGDRVSKLAPLGCYPRHHRRGPLSMFLISQSTYTVMSTHVWNHIVDKEEFAILIYANK
ncbi:hypothetical protein OAE15_00915 [Verrucomicrobiales bacterium]|jgi:hypothetical protein|nr:hypothetical protein [Verrucomicrobiales bacterium]